MARWRTSYDTQTCKDNPGHYEPLAQNNSCCLTENRATLPVVPTLYTHLVFSDEGSINYTRNNHVWLHRLKGFVYTLDFISSQMLDWCWHI